MKQGYKMKLIIEKKFKAEETDFYFTLVKLHKSYLLLVSDQEDMGIGNVTLSTPPMNKESKPTSASHALFGMVNSLLSKTLAEKASILLDSTVLLLLFLKSGYKEETLVKPLGNFLSEILSKN